MAQTGASDLLSYLLVAGEREARHLRSQARRHDSERYAAIHLQTRRDEGP
ncbi:hypothetical protein KSD_46630 [Ktedonobacter sp. SOSP1-85]|nr:hypothetical protein [Ktedonobacter sp. SOSP1-85]GHO76892.1 hypothetical protein KSD_46630 [Ktedonobacter sp. SOSP1-85]